MKYIAYYRVSTTKQGQSGLGLAAQRATVNAYCQGGVILAEYQDIESGKKSDRPGLLKAIAHAKQHGATLVIAKLDRLSRNLSFIAALMDAKVHFVACDMPTANNFTIHIFAALAQQERELISERTKKALAALKAQGKALGRPEHLDEEVRTKGLQQRQHNARTNANNVKARAMIRSLAAQGLTNYAIAKELNQSGFVTRRGCQFRPTQVARLRMQ